MQIKKYNILNNTLGWFCFLVATVTYLLTLEPTASFWDCPEFILQGFKLEVGHPPGNPIFMFVARFFANFAFGDVTKVAIMVNAMSALLSAATILLLFWTITHLTRKMIVKDDATEISLTKSIVIFGSGLCGALMYTWSDTFWFSAVEGEVYAFSSFCTALVFWLILKWENRADRPSSDKYLILIAYVIGISIAVHLLNLLCIPAIALVYYYKKSKNSTVKGSILTLLGSFAIIVLVLYGLVPGFIDVSQVFERFCVNTLGMSFNMGVIIYAAATVAALVWTIYNLYNYKKVSPILTKMSFILSTLLSGVLFIGDSWLIPTVLLVGLIVFLAITKRLPVRLLTLASLSILVIFAGYSSYALLLIRSSAHTPMNQNAPDNVFALASYLNREQYGDRPLLYGETFYSPYAKVSVVEDDGSSHLKVEEGRALYARQLKENPSDPDRYIMTGHEEDVATAPELNMLLPRMHSVSHINSYDSWVGGLENKTVEASTWVDTHGNVLQTSQLPKPSFVDNLRFFFIYQLNHMYWRYFMWNFAGRQNDIQGQGETTHGNWISGIPVLDNFRLGDQSLLPDDYGKGNKGHNVFFMLPLLIGIFGFVWQATVSKRGIEQFWVIFFLFFMTGIAIVLYLNQTPDQPRERDYAFAGSFYAYAIWVGMGVAGLWHAIMAMIGKRKELKLKNGAVDYEIDPSDKKARIAAIIAAVIGILIPLQVVSQTWDDHDRSGRYTARDFGMNYLNSLDENAIIFTYGDNDTFPLWYAQEVEGVRTDVKVINLSYFTTDWYINQMRRQTYDSPGIALQATPDVYAYNKAPFFSFATSEGDVVDATTALAEAYSKKDFDDQYYNQYIMKHPNMNIPIDRDAVIKAGRASANDSIAENIEVRRRGENFNPERPGGISINDVMVLDVINTNAKNGWQRPIYFATTVPDENYVGLSPYFSNTGMAYEVTPLMPQEGRVNTDKMYRNITERWRWGGLDQVGEDGDIYLDETVRKMSASTRSVMFELALGLAQDYFETMLSGDTTEVAKNYMVDRKDKIDHILALQEEKIPERILPYGLYELDRLMSVYQTMYQLTADEKYKTQAVALIERQMERFAGYLRYYQSISATHYRMLSRMDRANEYFLRQLIETYALFVGEEPAIEKLVDLQSRYNVNIERYFTEKE